MEWSAYLRFALALLFVLGLIGLLAWAARRFGLTPRVTAGAQGRRLAVVEVAAVDARRRLVLLRRDQTEHLVLLGGAQELLVEAGITPPTEAAPVRAGEAAR